MLALERHRRLVSFVNARGSLRTAEVAAELGVTEETVRRDFEKLEREGALVRTHGGALRIEAGRGESPLGERMAQNVGAKTRIARAALAHLRDGSVVFFDSSTTVLQLAGLLPSEMRVTVLTNSLPTAMALLEKPGVAVHMLGGQVGGSSFSCTGRAAWLGLELLRLDAAFFSCRGIHPAHGLSEASEDHAALKNLVIQRADSAILLADHSKTTMHANHYFAQLAEIDLWITDQEPDHSVLEAANHSGTRWEAAP